MDLLFIDGRPRVEKYSEFSRSLVTVFALILKEFS